MSPSTLHICTYYKRIANLPLICDAMRRMPDADPLIICNGDPQDLEGVCEGISVAVQNNKWRCMGRHLEARKLLQEKDYDYILNTDDDVITQPALLEWLLSHTGGDKKVIVSGWGHRLRPPFDDYWKRVRVTDLTECHYAGAQVVLYPADFIRELPLDRNEITRDMIEMDDIWMSYQAIRRGYKQLGVPRRHWQLRESSDEYAMYGQLGSEKKKRYWNELFHQPEFVREYDPRIKSIWAQQSRLDLVVREVKRLSTPAYRKLRHFWGTVRRTAVRALFAMFGLLAVAGGYAAYYMEHHGHYVTGMSNQIVWGMPHVFAIFLIVAASGVLNVASIGSVFGRPEYKPLARLSALLAVALLAGGLAILVLDLGRPDRLIVAMTYYNFKSIFAWNIFLYTGFFAVVILYMWTMFERRMAPHVKAAGIVALVWRLVLTTGTGSIFGFLVARQAYDAAVMGPMFIVMSFSFGLAVFIPVLMGAAAIYHHKIADAILFRLKNLLGIFVAATLYFVFVFNITNLYAAEHGGVERFMLADGGIYPKLFWIVQIGLGSLLPLALFYWPPTSRSRTAVWLGSVFVLIGAFAQVYVIIIAGQAYPLVMFPGMEESSSFFDGAIAEYTPSTPEIVLGLGGIGLALVLVGVGLKALNFLPRELFERRRLPQTD